MAFDACNRCNCVVSSDMSVSNSQSVLCNQPPQEETQTALSLRPPLDLLVEVCTVYEVCLLENSRIQALMSTAKKTQHVSMTTINLLMLF
jgi:hypothetical protein